MTTWFITGSDTGVGKTVLTTLLARYLQAAGVKVRAVKPFCSGGREDALAVFAAQNGMVPLDEINPWHFRKPLAPLVAARLERRRVTLPEAVQFIRWSQRQCDVLLIEGAGGVLSPLGEGFSARELIVSTRACPIVVCADRLGAINQALMALASFPRVLAKRARVVLSQNIPDVPRLPSNVSTLAELIGPGRVHTLEHLPDGALITVNDDPIPIGLRRKLAALLAD